MKGGACNDEACSADGVRERRGSGESEGNAKRTENGAAVRNGAESAKYFTLFHLNLMAWS